ncbi:TetR/AcrR family transcriptional regulator [Nocardiopsis ansamitocini]|uniref:TetR family transcriptional regulator n=1 Tax=Nocardiopsis ansamitocini TaxID=1670832 RepID=A0A9W6P272_9ACTN|nr:TetR/AcrR family transcriptional regulator [Nocardiopsis ansamitocini]GLU45668.1 TetR family transcriptional regulator [Nocardiopsis ansamitocini]
MSIETDTRARLVAAAIRLLADGGPGALQARKVAAESGASTMAVYTYFGGMGALVEAVAHEGFRRLTANLDRVPRTDDPVADIIAQGYAYRHTAVEHPNLYWVTFGLFTPGGQQAPEYAVTDASDAPNEAFGRLVHSAARAVEAGRFAPSEPELVAAQLWSGLHGYVTLELSGHFGPGGQGVATVLGPFVATLVVGLGDSPDAAGHSGKTAVETWRRITGDGLGMS